MKKHTATVAILAGLLTFSALGGASATANKADVATVKRYVANINQAITRTTQLIASYKADNRKRQKNDFMYVKQLQYVRTLENRIKDLRAALAREIALLVVDVTEYKASGSTN